MFQLSTSNLPTSFVQDFPGRMCPWQCIRGDSKSHYLLPWRISWMHKKNCGSWWHHQSNVQSSCRCWCLIKDKQRSGWTMH